MAHDLPLKYDPIPYLEQRNEPWIKYNLERLHGKKGEEEYNSLRKDPMIQALIDECVYWPDPPLGILNDSSHPIHKIELLADLGLDIRDEWIKALSRLILQNHSEDGMYQSKIEVSKSPLGKNPVELTWRLCDTSILVYALQKFGVESEETKEATRMLVWLSENNGWRCKAGIPGLHGPGKKSEHCPYANLLALKALSLSQYKDSEEVRNGIDSHIMHWENKKDTRIRGFGMGEKFMKLKYPHIWFDILHLVEVLSHYQYAREYEAFWDMWRVISDKQQEEGGFIPEQVYGAWRGWSFGQKKQPSPWITLRILMIAERIR